MLGYEDCLVNALNVCQKKAARLVTSWTGSPHPGPHAAVWMLVSEAASDLPQLGTPISSIRYQYISITQDKMDLTTNLLCQTVISF